METGILFDLDGTLLNTLDDIVGSVNHTLGVMGYPHRTKEEVRRFVGNGSRNLMEQVLPEGGDVDEAVREFQRYYSAHCQELTRPYDGIVTVLEVLKKEYPIAIVSNKPDAAVKPLCNQHFPGVYARGESADCPRKPAPDMVFKAMEALGVSRCIYVGDSEVDIVTAKNADVPCISVLWGFRDREEIEAVGGKFFCEHPEDLPKMLKSLADRSDT